MTLIAVTKAETERWEERPIRRINTGTGHFGNLNYGSGRGGGTSNVDRMNALDNYDLDEELNGSAGQEQQSEDTSEEDPIFQYDAEGKRSRVRPSLKDRQIREMGQNQYNDWQARLAGMISQEPSQTFEQRLLGRETPGNLNRVEWFGPRPVQTGEPMNLTWRLLKEQPRWKEPYTPYYRRCSNCGEFGSPADFGETPGNPTDNYCNECFRGGLGILTGEAMNLAWRLLKKEPFRGGAQTQAYRKCPSCGNLKTPADFNWSGELNLIDIFGSDICNECKYSRYQREREQQGAGGMNPGNE